MDKKKLSHSSLQSSVTSVLAALLCILIGLIVGFLVLLAINPALRWDWTTSSCSMMQTTSSFPPKRKM